jgi:hypothetical protein
MQEGRTTYLFYSLGQNLGAYQNLGVRLKFTDFCSQASNQTLFLLLLVPGSGMEKNLDPGPGREKKS